MSMFSTAIPTTQPKPAKKARRNIPAALVREVVEGIPFYYPGTSVEQWAFPKWDSEIEVMSGVTVNIARLVEEEGINLG